MSQAMAEKCSSCCWVWDATGLELACRLDRDAAVCEGPAIRTQSEKLQCWFGLSHASWMTIPRVLMEAMPLGWQDKMADLLNEYEETFPNQPDIETVVQIREGGRLVKTPGWLIDYRHPDMESIDVLRKQLKGDAPPSSQP